MSAGDDMLKAASEAREQADVYRRQAAKMRATASDLEGIATDLDRKAKLMEVQGADENAEEKRAEEEINSIGSS